MTLPYAVVDPHSPVPLYHQIYLDLRHMIQNGILPAGEVLPPEIEICQAYNVGRQTVRQAIARLVDEDLVERFAGKGTFVRSVSHLKQFFLDRSFSQQMRELGRVPHSRVISQMKGTVDSESVPILMKLKGSPCMTLERLRLGDDEPVCHQISTVLIERLPGIEEIDFSEASLFETLATRYNVFINRFDHVVRAVAADEYRASLLNVEEGTPLLLVVDLAYDDEDRVVESSASYYRADRYAFITTDRRSDEK